MSRDFDPRDDDHLSSARDHGRERDFRDRNRNRSEPRSREDPWEAFTRNLDLPRGRERERIHVRGHDYDLRGSETRTLATVGSFRVVPADRLRDHNNQPADARHGDVRHLRESGLVKTVKVDGRSDVVVLTDRGRDVLDASRRDVDVARQQEFYSGLTKPRELAHDSTLYDAYLDAAERLSRDGAEIQRVVLDYKLKSEYQSFLQEHNRGRSDSDGRPDRTREEIEAWAEEHDLPTHDGPRPVPRRAHRVRGRVRPRPCPRPGGRNRALSRRPLRGERPVPDSAPIARHRDASAAASLAVAARSIHGRRRGWYDDVRRRTQALQAYGFTMRQAQFLVTVMLHSGVCVERQYCAFAGIVHGQKSRNFFNRLLAKRYAVVHQFPSKHQGRIFHIRQKRLYAAIVQENNRNRRSMPVHGAIERLMLLDAVLADRSLTWLGTEADKVFEFARTAEGYVDALPHIDYRSASGRTRRRHFTDKLPIGVESGGFRYVFVYLVNRHDTFDFRGFLLRHAPLFTRLYRWSIRLLVPVPFRGAAPAYVAAVYDQLARPLELRDRHELEWYFSERQRLCRVSGPSLDPDRLPMRNARMHASGFR